MFTWKRPRCYLSAAKMATSNSAATMDQTAKGKERMAKAKDGTAKAKDKTTIAKDKGAKAKEPVFVWSDDEVELLLKVTHDYKVKKAAENVDWESVRSKYSDIWEAFGTELPPSPEEAREIGKDYPHTKEEITKQAVSTKLKAVRLKYRQAVDTGRKSGHGRVVLLFFEWCEKIWGCSPATDQIPSGVESVDLDETPASEDSTLLSIDPSPPSTTEAVDANENTQASGGESSTQTRVQQRRAFLDEKLSNYKQEKLKRKLPVDSQLVGFAKEDLEVKRRLLDQMQKMDTQHVNNMAKLSTNMDRLTDSIADGFSLLRGLLLQQPPMYQPPQQQMYPSQHMYHPPPRMMHPPFSGQQQAMLLPTTSADNSLPTTSHPEFEDDPYTFHPPQ